MNLRSILGFGQAGDYSVGQVWSYRTRAGEEDSTLLINQIEKTKKFGNVYHISLKAVKVRNDSAPGGFSRELPHFPVSEETLKKSLVQVVGKSALHPGYREGYKTWKAAFDEGQAGVFTISVSEIVEFIENAINQS